MHVTSEANLRSTVYNTPECLAILSLKITNHKETFCLESYAATGSVNLQMQINKRIS